MSALQQHFKAKPVPGHVHEQRYEATAVGVEAARLAAKVRAEMAREKAAAKLQEAYKKRCGRLGCKAAQVA